MNTNFLTADTKNDLIESEKLIYDVLKGVKNKSLSYEAVIAKLIRAAILLPIKTDIGQQIMDFEPHIKAIPNN